MDLSGRTVALYGRFQAGVRDRLEREVVLKGGVVSRDLTRRSDVLVVGALATALVDSGALSQRLNAARAHSVSIYSERAFAAALAGRALAAATLPLAQALSGGSLKHGDAEILAAFDVIRIEADRCRFGDAAVIRTAAQLVADGRSLGEAVRILTGARDLAPRGRHRIVLTPSGKALLQWPDGLTSLEGQGLLPLEEANATLEDLFEAAALAEADGDLEEAARLYDSCARVDRSDPIAPYNFGNIRLNQGAHDQAVLAYRQALARDPRFLEARYNLAQALEAAGKPEAAVIELDQVLQADPEHPDAVFNLAQLTMKAGDMGSAKALYERYLALDPPEDWAQTARKAIRYCTAKVAAS